MPVLNQSSANARSVTHHVLRYQDCDRSALSALLSRFGLIIELVDQGRAISGSFWGDEEAGLIDARVFARNDTPVHSILHETCHFICMDSERRNGLHTNAGGGYNEENAVCFLQIVLADYLPDMSRERMCAEMDQWGYTFRLGSAESWFERDAEDTREWLIFNKLLNRNGELGWRLRR